MNHHANELLRQMIDKMRVYSDAHQVEDLLKILLTRLLEAQPLDPYEFLIEAVQNDDDVLALEEKARVNRFDLRREKTKRALVVACFKRMLFFQHTQSEDKFDQLRPELSLSSLLHQLSQEETRKQLRSDFPRHYRDIVKHFLDNQRSLPDAITMDAFTDIVMRILSAISSG